MSSAVAASSIAASAQARALAGRTSVVHRGRAALNGRPGGLHASQKQGATRGRANTVDVRADFPVPVAVQTTSGQMMDCFGALMMNRIIFIGERIDEQTASRVCAELLALQYEDPTKDITIFLNSVAGTQYCVTTILDMMDYVKCDISVVAMGCVAGPPAMILAGATKGKRLAYPNARIILSQPLGGLSGTSYEVKIQAKELNRNARVQVAFFAKFTGKDFDSMSEFLVRDTYMSPEEAIKENIIDGVIEPRDKSAAR